MGDQTCYKKIFPFTYINGTYIVSIYFEYIFYILYMLYILYYILGILYILYIYIIKIMYMLCYDVMFCYMFFKYSVSPSKRR